MDLGVKLLYENSLMPTKGHESDACFDLYLSSATLDEEGFVATCYSGIALDIPQGYMVKIYPRSSIAQTGWMLANSVGIIDSDYTGEVMLKLIRVSLTQRGFPYSPGDRFAQMRLEKNIETELNRVTTIKETQRGSGGFGSTGK